MVFKWFDADVCFFRMVTCDCYVFLPTSPLFNTSIPKEIKP